MKKILNIAFATYVILTALSNLNAASEADVAAVEEVDAALVRGCQTEALQTFKCPLELPGFYKINPEGLKEFLSVVPAAQKFYAEQEDVAKKAGLSADDYARLTEFQTAQVIAQAYFGGTREQQYVYKIPFVSGNEDAVLEIAQKTGLLTMIAPLAAYVQYKHLTAAIGDKRTLVLGCGNASLDEKLYNMPNFYMMDHTGFVSSGCHCNHDKHVTVARTPGILPTIVADIFDPIFQAGLLAAAKDIGGFEVIIDEYVLMGMEKQAAVEAIAFFKSLLTKDGKLVACKHPGFEVL
ncbi:MAG: hypothetical protein NT128_03455 [Proteobacteria bacterium]|nr:hypothetical protein [Pseudomonadota bacterium]